MLNARRFLRNISSPPPLRYRDFRILWLSGVFNSVGFMGEMVVLGWVLLELTDSPFMVGVGMGVRMLPFLLFGILAGSVADRVDRRKLMIMLGLALAGVTSILSVIILSDMLAVWHLLIGSLMIGSLWGFYQTSRQSFAFDIVGPDHIVSAFGLISLGMRVGAIFGSLAVGFFLDEIGAGVCYLVISASYLSSSLILMFAHPQGQVTASEESSLWRSMAEFVKEIRDNPNLLALVMLTAAVEILGFSHQVLLPSLARDVLHVGSDGLGVMNAVRALGGIIAVLIVSSFGDRPRKGLSFLTVLLVFGGGLVFLGNVSTFLPALFAVMLISGMATLSDVYSQSMMQTAVPNALRGRAMGAWVFAVGTAPVGQLQIGWLASALGLSVAISANGVVLAALAVGCYALLPRLRRL
ncbi:MAG: MFS transporter [Chloroflexi bacterium]|nr:MFS transporter [Chloroflexota bacterium]